MTFKFNMKQHISNTVFYGKDGYQQLQRILDHTKPSKVFILTDQNTAQHCAPKLLTHLSHITDPVMLQIPNGEQSKSIDQCKQLWQFMSDQGADRRSMLLNLGGGVVTDLGGFVAGTFMRGLKFINIPTTLLGMVDAAIGGKTGVDLDGLKNQIGIMHFPELVLVDPNYLKTLSSEDVKSGWAEVMKHGLIEDRAYWEFCSQMNVNQIINWETIILTSNNIKLKVVQSDTYEKDNRKILNFGHTFGHAIETYRLKKDQSMPLSHGAAVAIGMVMAVYFSVQLTGLDSSVAVDIRARILHYYKLEHFDDNAQKSIEELLVFDKKNSEGQPNFILLESIGKAVIDQKVTSSMYSDAFRFYATGEI